MFVEASCEGDDGQAFGRLLASVTDEYQEFRKADMAMQMHRANWMAQIERVMRQQEEVKACFEAMRSAPRMGKVDSINDAPATLLPLEPPSANPNSLAGGVVAIGDSYEDGRLPAEMLVAPPPPAPWKAQTLPPLPALDLQSGGATSARGSSTIAPSSMGTTPKASPRGALGPGTLMASNGAVGPQVNIERLCVMSTKPQVSEVALHGSAPSKPFAGSGPRVLDLTESADDVPPMPYMEGMQATGPGSGFSKLSVSRVSLEERTDQKDVPEISFTCLTPSRPQPLTSWPDWGKKLEVEEANAAHERMKVPLPPGESKTPQGSPRLQQASVRIQASPRASRDVPAWGAKDVDRWSGKNSTVRQTGSEERGATRSNKRASGSDPLERDATRHSSKPKQSRAKTGSAEPPTFEFSDSLVPQPVTTLNESLLFDQQDASNGHAEDIKELKEVIADVNAVVLVEPNGTGLRATEEGLDDKESDPDAEKEGGSEGDGDSSDGDLLGEDDSQEETLARRELLVAGNGSWSGMKRLSARQSTTPSMEEKPQYEVYDPYHASGLSQAIARSEIFQNTTLGIISMNAIYIGIEADRNPHENLNDADPFFQVSENAFCCYFTFEWLVRFFAFKCKRNCLRDMWFKFDSCLVVLMILETWLTPAFLGGSPGTGLPTGMVKLLRLLRLARMARLMRAFPELVAMIKGLQEASRAVGSALMMVLLLIYIFAIIMRMLMENTYSRDPLLEERFATLPICMWTLFMDGTLLDGVSITTRALYKYECYGAFLVLWLFVLMSAMTVMNMLIGVLCEVVTAVAAAEKEEAAIRLVKETVLVMLKKLDEDGSGEISKDEMNMVFDDEAALQVLASLQVDMTHLVDYLDMYFEQQSELSIYQIMDLILMLRGDRVPTMKDMLDREAFARWKFSASLDMLENRMRPALYRS